LAVAIAACCLLAAPAGAKVITDKVTGQKFGIVPTPPPPPHGIAGQRALIPRTPPTPTCDSAHVDSNCASLMTLHGGLVMHGERVMLFFWDPNGFASEPGYVSDMQSWVNNLAANDYTTGNSASAVGNPISVAQQYYDMSGPGGTKNFVPYAVTNGGTVMDTDPYPSPNGCTDSYLDYYAVTPPTPPPTVTLATCLTAGQLIAELHSYIINHHLPTGINTEYFILTPPNVGSCDDGTSATCAIAQYCGWHTVLGLPSSPSTQIVYADMPWLAGTTCDVNRAESWANAPTTYPNLYTSGIDAVVGVFSHELAESMTDPDPLTGWFGSGGGADEIGDKCAYQYSVGLQYYDLTGLPATGGGAIYNTTLNGSNYLLQMEFDNSANGGAGGCNQWDTDTQPTAAISPPASPRTGIPASFSLTGVSDPAGIAYVTWAFGDGSFGRSTGTASISHTYAAAGLRTVTAVITDNHGNELRDTAPVTVTQAPASLLVKLSTTHPAPKGFYTVRLSGQALPGGTLGTGHNRSEVDLYEQPGPTCAGTQAGEKSRAGLGRAQRIGQWFTGAGAFAFSQKRQALGSQHTTVRFCGYVSKSASVTEAKATSAYTTT
jgi:hypothetical protein